MGPLPSAAANCPVNADADDVPIVSVTCVVGFARRTRKNPSLMAKLLPLTITLSNGVADMTLTLVAFAVPPTSADALTTGPAPASGRPPRTTVGGSVTGAPTSTIELMISSSGGAGACVTTVSAPPV